MSNLTAYIHELSFLPNIGIYWCNGNYTQLDKTDMNIYMHEAHPTCRERKQGNLFHRVHTKVSHSCDLHLYLLPTCGDI